MLCAALATAVLTSCAPQAAPTPTPTPHFTSDQQAYAAAEQTYRNYIDAINDVDLGDPATFEDVYMWATGQRRDEDKKALSSYHANGVQMSGKTLIPLLQPGRLIDARTVVMLAACLDVSNVEIHAKDGSSLVSSDRPDIQSVSVELSSSSNSNTGYLVSAILPRDGAPTC